MLQAAKPKTARAAREVAKREPQISENPKIVLFLKYTSTSEILQMAMRDLYSLKKPLAVRFTKKNSIHPFEDAASFEFFSEKNDTSLVCFGSHSKKRPHAMTIARCFDHKIMDMIEFLVVPETLRTLTQFKNPRKPAVGLKPLISFSGAIFESPTPNSYTLAKSLLLDFFKGPEISQVDVEGLQYIVHISANEETPAEPKPIIRIRCYMIRTKKSGSRLPRVELEEMGPRIDLRVGRVRESDPDMMKEALKKPKTSEPRTKKNIETDLMGDQLGRIHIGKQDLSKLQSRKMKGLKRSRDEDGAVNGDADAKKPRS